jgi:hypothetical protein
MVNVASIYLRFHIEVGVGVCTFLQTPTPPKIPSDYDITQNSFRLLLHSPAYNMEFPLCSRDSPVIRITPPSI